MIQFEVDGDVVGISMLTHCRRWEMREVQDAAQISAVTFSTSLLSGLAASHRN